MKLGVLGWDTGDRLSRQLERVACRLGCDVHYFTLDDVTCVGGPRDLDVYAAGRRASELQVIVSRAQLKSPADLEKLALLDDLPSVRLLNRAHAAAATKSKLVALHKLSLAGLPVPPTTTCRSVAEIEGLIARHGRIVLKPSVGWGGCDVERFGDEFGCDRERMRGLLQRHATIIGQPYLSHPEGDMRMFVLGGSFARTYCIRRVPPKGVWKTNVTPDGKGALVLDFTPSPVLEKLALAAARTLDLDIAAVDFVESGGHWIIECNSVPGWARPDDPSLEERTAAEILEFAAREAGAGSGYMAAARSG